MTWSPEATKLMHDVYLPNSLTITEALEKIDKEAGFAISYGRFRDYFRKEFGVSAGSCLGNNTSEIQEDSIVKQLERVIKSHPPVEIKDARSPDSHSIVICLSDLHFGTNTKTAIKRIHAIIDAALSLVNLRTQEFVVLCLGDMVDGQGIFPGQCFHLEDDAPGQVVTVRNVLWEMFVTLACKLPVKVGCAYGNHGRTSHRKDMTRSHRSNWDWVLYMTLDAMARVYGSRIAINYCSEEFNTFNIRGHRGLLSHELPPQIQTEARRSKVAGWADIYDVDFMACGHRHDPSIAHYNGRPIITNGALADPNEFAKTKIARISKPTQFIFNATNKNLLTEIHPIVLS